MSSSKTIIIGGGVAAIATAHKLKCQLGHEEFTIYEKRSGPGGTWIANTYPGCGSDVPIHLYSFSFNLNPNWTQALADQEEILEYIESTVDKFHLRKHFCFGVECLGAEWNQGAWSVRFRDVNSGQQFTEQCAILLSAVGGFAVPREARFPGLNKFKGHVFHTAEWNHLFEYTNKRIAVIGNGCSAAQVVPAIAPSVKKITQYARSPQWHHPRPNKLFTQWERFCFKYIPLWQRWHRLDLFLKTDQLASVYGSNASQVSARLQLEDEARQYILSEAPERYHDFIVPKFPLGCKRRIYDPGYLASLRRDNVELLAQGIREFTETGLISEDGVAEDFDAVILATGFSVSSFLAPMKIVGRHGKSLHEQWEEHRGAQAYMGTFVHNHPNFAIL
ncbi:FAD-binding monooxygenase ktnD like protein [Verticillium longisporum]|nr:FAD-binding monooxygenase ktnD like protein [Verticillium longisporum]